MKVMGFVQNEMKWRVCIVEVIVESAEELNIRSSRINLNDNFFLCTALGLSIDRELHYLNNHRLQKMDC